MSVTGAIGGFFRGTLIAAATAAAAFGLLAVFQPFARAPEPVAVVADNAGAQAALQGRIEALRLSLRDTETAIGDASAVSGGAAPTSDANRMQYEAQIAAATERRDLALRHAAAIRAELEAGGSVSSLTGIRDSVVIGQLLSQLAALEAQIAIEGARLLAAHPTMRALNAQRASLQTQIRQEATNIAAALEAEAKLDNAQIALLQGQLPAMASAAAPADTSALEAKAAAQRAELDRLVDAYFNIPPATADRTAVASDPFSLPNRIVIGVAAFAAIAAQVLLAFRRRRTEREAEDMAAWEADEDPELEADLISEPEPLRRAS